MDPRIYGTVLVTVCFICGAYAQSVVEQAEDGNSGTISFKTPDMNDDDAHSPWMPDQLKCDACRIVSFQFWKTFYEFNEKRKSLKGNIPESELMDIMDSLCDNDKTWESYGMKEIKKVKRLSGAGMETSDVPGVTAGGGKWPTRLRDMCQQYSAEIGEVGIYNVYKKNPKSRKKLEDFLCRSSKFKIRGECYRWELEEKRQAEEKKKQQKEAEKKAKFEQMRMTRDEEMEKEAQRIKEKKMKAEQKKKAKEEL